MYKITENGKNWVIMKSEQSRSLPVHDKKHVINPFFKDKISYHDFKIKLPIIKHGRLNKPDKEVQVNGWIKEFYNLELPVKITLEITTKSAILHFHSTELPRNSRFFAMLFSYAWKGTAGVVARLGQYGYKIDLMNAEVINQHIATQTNDATDKQVPNNSVVELGLNRKSKTITGTSETPAKAWIDKSKGKLEIETNDLLYEEKLLKMPETVEEMRLRLIKTERMVEVMAGALNQIHKAMFEPPKSEPPKSVEKPKQPDNSAYR
jgi:hypothetical protein